MGDLDRIDEYSVQQSVEKQFGQVFRSEWSRVVATLVRDFKDLDLAEDATQEAFVVAAKNWTAETWPDAPRAWLLTVARRKAIDRLRSKKRGGATPTIPETFSDYEITKEHELAVEHGLVDDHLALILGCCHPSLPLDGQVALTLRAVAGLTTAQIARAFLVTESTMTRRLTRSKDKIRKANIVFRTDHTRLAERVSSVCAVIYSIYTEGHTSTNDPELVRADLCDEALWLAGLVADLVPDDPEAKGLLALLLFSDARRSSRTNPGGAMVLLAAQDRNKWDADKMTQGRQTLAAAHSAGRLGPYQVQAAIAALHAAAPSFEQTDWHRIIDLYDVLLSFRHDAVAGLNRAAAVGHCLGASEGLEALAKLSDQDQQRLSNYSYFHACRGEFLLEVGDVGQAQEALAAAVGLTKNEAERNHLADRLAMAKGG